MFLLPICMPFLEKCFFRNPARYYKTLQRKYRKNALWYKRYSTFFPIVFTNFCLYILNSASCYWNIVFINLCITMAEKAMAPHSTTLVWKIPWMEEPGRLQSMGSLRVGHGWVTSFSLFTFMHWRRKCQPNPVFLPGESQGQRSLGGCRLWGRTESDTTEAT